MSSTDSNLIETIVLYLALAAFAYLGVTSIAPRIGAVLERNLNNATLVEGGANR